MLRVPRVIVLAGMREAAEGRSEKVSRAPFVMGPSVIPESIASVLFNL